MFEGGTSFILSRKHCRDSIVGGLTFLLSVVKGLLEFLGLSVFFGELLELGAALFSNTLVCKVRLFDLLIEAAALFILTGAFSTLLLLLETVHLLKLAVDGDVHLDLLVVLHIFHFVVNQLLLDCVELLQMLGTVVCVYCLRLLGLKHHLRLEFITHLIALASETHGLLTLFSGPVADVPLDLCSPLGISHTNNLTLHAHADLVVWVDHHLAGGDTLGATDVTGGLGDVRLSVVIIVGGGGVLGGSCITSSVGFNGTGDNPVDLVKLTLTYWCLLTHDT